MKRILTLIIILTILCSSFSITAFGQEHYPVIWISEEYLGVWQVSEGMFTAHKTFREGNKYIYNHGFIDKTGKEVIPFIYDRVEPFKEGLAVVSKDRKWGYIDKTGKVIIPFIYDDAKSFSNGLARVSKDKKWYYIDNTGKTILGPLNYLTVEDFKDGFAKVSVGTAMESYGLIDRTGKEIVPPIYRIIEDFHEGLATVQDWYYIRSGVINTAGEIVIPLIYQGVGKFVGGIAYASKNSRYGIIDKNGKTVVPFIYGNIEDFSYGLARVIDITDLYNHKHGYIDKTGKFIVPLSHNWYEWQFTDGLAAVGVKDETTDKFKVGFIDSTGKMVIEPKYGFMTTSRLHTFQNGFAIVSDSDSYDAKFGIIDKTGKEIVPIIYDSIGDLVSIYPAFNEGLAIVRKDRMVGAVDTTGKLVIPMIFDGIEEFNEGLAVARKDGKTCIIETPIKTASPTSSVVMIDGKEISFDAYNISGYNYFKLRDLAFALRDTEKRFNVKWDNVKQVMHLISDEAYTSAGGELTTGIRQTVTAALNTSIIYKDHNQVTLYPYTINGSNYFKLRDIARIFDFSVGFDGKTNKIIIDISKSYVEN